MSRHPVNILLVRHGETNGNRTRTLQLATTPLSDKGHAQAKLVGARLAKELGSRPFKIISSDLQRAMDTAIHIAVATSKTISTSSLLQERSFGDLRGTKYDDLLKRNIMVLSDDYQPPNGESWAQFRARIDEAWAFVVAQAKLFCEENNGGILVVVSHGLVLFDLFDRKIAQLPPGKTEEDAKTFGNTCLSYVVSEDDGATFKALSLNDTAHLHGDTAHDKKTVSGL